MYSKAWQKIREASHLLLATHLNPDADTLGSALGLYHVLRRMGKKVTLFNASTLPYNLDFLPGITRVRRELPKDFDLLVALDCASFDRLGIEEEIKVDILNIDHHPTNERYGAIDLVEPDFVATAQVVYTLFVHNGVVAPKESAVALYTALVDDSGFFRYENVKAPVFSMAAQLCQWGADPAWVAKMLTMREPLAKLVLIQKLLGTLELHLCGKVGVITLTRRMLEETGATKEMADDALAMVRSLATVEVAVLLREEEDGRIKVSLRSKEVDVGRIAVEFGGGGHKNAAGFTDGYDMQELLSTLLARLRKELPLETE